MFKLLVREQILVREMKGKFWVLAVIISAVVAGSAGYFACLYLGQRVTLGDDTYKAVEIGRNYLENGLSRGGPGPWVGDLLQVKLESEGPNYYWYGYPWEEEVDRPVASIQPPDYIYYVSEGRGLIHEPLILCWIIRFEQAKRPGHWFEVWVDADSGDVVGGMQCK